MAHWTHAPRYGLVGLSRVTYVKRERQEPGHRSARHDNSYEPQFPAMYDTPPRQDAAPSVVLHSGVS